MSYEVDPSSASEEFVEKEEIKTVKNYITCDFGKRHLLITLGNEIVIDI